METVTKVYGGKINPHYLRCVAFYSWYGVQKRLFYLSQLWLSIVLIARPIDSVINLKWKFDIVSLYSVRDAFIVSEVTSTKVSSEARTVKAFKLIHN